MNPARKLSVKELAKFVLFLLLAVFLIFFAFRGTNFKGIVKEIFKARFVWIFFSFSISIVALVIRAYRWNLLIEPLGYKPPLHKTFYAVTIGYFANLAFPRLGEVTRCGSLSKSQSIPFNVLLGTVITERIIDVISLIICIVITTALEFNRLSHFIRNSIIKPVGNKLRFIWSSPFLVLAVIIIIGILCFFFLQWYQKSKTGNDWKGKFIALIAGVFNGIKSIRELKKPWSFIFHSVFIWLLYYLSVFVALFALPQTEHLGFTAALFLLVAGGIGMSAPVQGGIGAYHLLVSQGLMLYGLSQQDGLAFATLVHSLQIIMILLAGSISLIAMAFERPAVKAFERNEVENEL